MHRFVVTLCAVLVAVMAAPAAGQDAKGCKDHPLFTRMSNFDIYACKEVEFEALDFPKPGLKAWNGPDDYEAIEGRVFAISYKLKKDATPASSLQIIRNFQNATKASGGTILGDYTGSNRPGFTNTNRKLLTASPGGLSYDRYTTLKLTKGESEYWVTLAASDDYHDYAMTIVQREAMKQEVSVNELVDKLNKDGFLTLYVNFDTNKATITPDSGKTLDEAASVLKTASSLSVTVAGHTDNVGSPEANQKLSDERAKAVMSALVERGIPATRMEAKGYGHTMPIADNRTEDGRAKNRRVELVKK
jgi:outer membrane protein OmpA-like peptidoglycan-associated protein